MGAQNTAASELESLAVLGAQGEAFVPLAAARKLEAMARSRIARLEADLAELQRRSQLKDDELSRVQRELAMFQALERERIVPIFHLKTDCLEDKAGASERTTFDSVSGIKPDYERMTFGDDSGTRPEYGRAVLGPDSVIKPECEQTAFDPDSGSNSRRTSRDSEKSGSMSPRKPLLRGNGPLVPPLGLPGSLASLHDILEMDSKSGRLGMLGGMNGKAGQPFEKPQRPQLPFKTARLEADEAARRKAAGPLPRFLTPRHLDAGGGLALPVTPRVRAWTAPREAVCR